MLSLQHSRWPGCGFKRRIWLPHVSKLANVWKTKVCKRAGGRDKEQSVYTKRSASSFGNFHTWYTIMAENVWEILSGWVAAGWHRSAVNVFATFCFVGFVLQRHANKKIPSATETERDWIEEWREADGKLNEYLVPFQSQLCDTCSFPLQEP